MEDIKRSPEKERRNYLIFGALSAVALTALILMLKPGGTSSEYPLRSMEFTKEAVWSQEFDEMDTRALDTDIWRYDTYYEVPTYNDEAQAYTNSPENVRIEPGVGLVIEAHQQEYTYPQDPTEKEYEYTSGRIDTLNSFTFEYGKIEASMKLPKGEGVWPAFWLLSANLAHTEGKNYTAAEENSERHYLHNGELDIMEKYGNNPNFVEGTVHTYNETTANGIEVPTNSDEFHTYAVELTPQSITWTVDGKPYHYYEKPSDSTDDWPFQDDNHLYIILNLAMGGPAGAINNQQEPWRLEVENIRFYSYTGKE